MFDSYSEFCAILFFLEERKHHSWLLKNGEIAKLLKQFVQMFMLTGSLTAAKEENQYKSFLTHQLLQFFIKN